MKNDRSGSIGTVLVLLGGLVGCIGMVSGLVNGELDRPWVGAVSGCCCAVVVWLLWAGRRTFARERQDTRTRLLYDATGELFIGIALVTQVLAFRVHGAADWLFVALGVLMALFGLVVLLIVLTGLRKGGGS